MLEYLHQHTGFQFLIGRLVTKYEAKADAGKLPFQFLIGRLVTVAEDMEGRKKMLFQFLIGRLVTPWRVPALCCLRGFNSS